MDSKVLLNIYLPATRESFEMWVPKDLSVHGALGLINSIIEERVGRLFKPGQSTALYIMSTGDELDVNMLIKDLGFVNGTQLVLM